MNIFKVQERFAYISLIVPIILTVSLFILSFFFFVIPTCRKIKIESKKEMLSEQVNSVISIIDSYESDVKDGIITKERARSEAAEIIKILRYGNDNKDYFWINDTCPKMIMHPYISGLNGQLLKDYKDKNGKNIFIESVNITRTNGEGFIDYYWQHADDTLTTIPKLSFVKRYHSWGWIIGTGIYMNDVNVEIAAIQKKLVTISFLIISVILLLLSYLMALMIRVEKRKKKIENELLEAKENYKTLIDNAPDTIMVYDIQQNRIVDINLVGQKLLCGSYAQILNTDPLFFFPKEQAGNNEMLDFFKKTLKGGQPVFIRLIRNLELKEFFCEIRLVKFPGNNGRLIRASIIDITLRKEAEEQTKKNEEQLRKLNEDKDRFFSILAHDLRSPFNSIIGFTSLLKNNYQNFESNQVEKYLSYIYISAQSTYNLLEDLLLWAGSQSGKLPFNLQICSFPGLIMEVLSVMRIIAQTKNITIVYHPVNQIDVQADKEMVKIILRNLISNAIKFSNQNSLIEICSFQENGELIISVSDNGIGISDDEVIQLFDARKINSRAGTALESGTGLGLILCKEFVEKNGGRIWVENKNGTRFSFSLPEFRN